jgi:alpha-1,2-mannosyltransferase
MPARFSPRFIRLSIIAGWVTTIVALLALLGRLRTLIAIRSDFTQDYMAVLAFRHGRSIYDLFSAGDLAAQGLQAEALANYHPPFNVLLFLPVALFPYQVAVVLWTLGLLLLYLLSGSIIVRELGISIPRYALPLLVGLSLLWYPFQFNIILGQLSLVLVACVIGGWALLRRRRDGLAGVLIGLAVLIKIFPALLLLYLVLRRRWWAVGSALVVIAAGMLLTLAAVGVGDVLRYQTEIVALNVADFRSSVLNVALTAVFNRLFVGDSHISPLVLAPPLATLLSILADLTLVLLLMRATLLRRATRRDDDVVYALLCVGMPLLSPTSWSHSFPLLLLPFGLLVCQLQARPERRLFQLGALTFVLLSLPDVAIARMIAASYEPARLPWYAVLPMALPTLGLLLLWWLVQTRVQPEPLADAAEPTL